MGNYFSGSMNVEKNVVDGRKRELNRADIDDEILRNLPLEFNNSSYDVHCYCYAEQQRLTIPDWVCKCLPVTVLADRMEEYEFESKLAGKFVRESLAMQGGLALIVATSLKSNVYLFDTRDYFADAEVRVIQNVRYKVKDGLYAVLSAASQKVFAPLYQANNLYLQYTKAYPVDVVDVYVNNAKE